jgi:hypothetical protein
MLPLTALWLASAAASPSASDCAWAPEGMLCVSAEAPREQEPPAGCPEPPDGEVGPLPTFFLDERTVILADLRTAPQACMVPLEQRLATEELHGGSPVRFVSQSEAAVMCRVQGKHLPSREEWRAGAVLDGVGPPGLPVAGAELIQQDLASGLRCAASLEEARLLALRADEPPVFLPLSEPTSLRQRVDGEAWRDLEAEGPLPDKAHATRDESYRARVGQPPLVEGGVVRTEQSFEDVWMVEDALFAWQRLYPDIVRVGVLGLSRQGRPVLALRISDHPDQDEDEPAVLINGAAHGHELLSTDYTLDAIERVLTGWSRGGPEARWVEQLDLWFVPLVNPDGNWTTLRIVSHPKGEIGRKNGRDNDGDCAWEPPQEGVDLNRNYPFAWGMLGEEGSKKAPWSPYFRGPSPGSEPEAQAIMRLADRYRFAASVSFHTWGTMIMSPYTVPGLTNPEPDTAWVVASEIAAEMPVQPNGRRMVVKKMMYPVDGTDQDWLYHQHGTLAYILEGSHHNPLDAALRRASTDGAWPFTRGLVDRVLDGPGLSGHVRDPQGRPLEATVHVAEIALQQGEDWRSRPHDGRFDRLLPGAGSWTLEAAAPGFAPARATVTVDEQGWETVELVLEPLGG